MMNINYKKNTINTLHEYEIRKKKLKEICKLGFNFPNDFQSNIDIKTINSQYSKYTKEELLKINSIFSIHGRIVTQRNMGKSNFIIIKDAVDEIQVYIKKNKISINTYYNQFKKLDIGDIIGIQGTIFKTNTQQLTIYCSEITLLSKAIRNLPDKFHGLSNQEIKYRKRYLDLLSNIQTMKTFQTRSKIFTIIRNFMNKNNFIEVETPMLQNIPGGASANPFETYHNALNIKMYLRIAPELYLKRLIIGGFNKIYEINKNFRNEGISTKHNPEFTMMELYIAYANYKDLMIFIFNLLRYIIKKVNKSYQLTYQNHILNFDKPFHTLTMKNAILHYNSHLSLKDLNSIVRAKKIAHSYNIAIKEHWKIGKIISKIFEITTENKLIQPTFITEYPIEISPLARRNNINTDIADRFELFIGGLEIGNGFSELNDSEDQKNRFLKKYNHEKKNNHNKIYDIDYITAMEYGMPPTAGLGIGLDRLIMIMTNKTNIRDIILFPILKPNKNHN